MKHILYIFSLLLLLGCEDDPTPIEVAVSTGDVTNIMTNSASVQVSMDKNDIIDEIGVLCSTDSVFNTSTIKSSTQEITGTRFIFQLSNLTAGSKYFYKAYAYGKSNSIYGITKSFMTEQLQLSTSVNDIEADDKESTYRVEIRSNTDWSTSSNQSWCEVSPDAGTQRDSINIKLKENTSTSARQAVVTVTAGNQVQKITIRQRGCDEKLSVSSNYFSVSPEKGSYDFIIYTNLSWDISSDQSWCIPSSLSGNGENALSFTTTENTLTQERNAILTVKAGTLTQKITVVQQSKSAILSVSTNTFAVNANKNTYNFTITSNMDWTISCDQSWCIPSIAAGSNNQTASFDVSENTSTQERSATISIKAGNLIQKITITQAGTNRIFAVSKDSFIFGPEAGHGEFSITSDTNWTITSNQSWCSIATTSGSNNKTISFTITPNTSTLGRTAIINVKTNSSSIQITVTQEGQKEIVPNLSVSPESLSVTASDQTSSFNISCNTNWTVSSNQTWCTPSETSGNGSKTITCSIAANTQSQTRTAIITVSAGNFSKTVTVTQEGKAEIIPNLSVSPESLSVTADDQTSSFSISSNTDWTISSNQAWCTPSETSGSGNKTITCSIVANTQSQARTAAITVSGGNLSKTITVTQEGKTVAIINIPDANFKAYLVKNFDIDNDGELSEEEAYAIETIDCEHMNISSLDGIEKIPNVSILRCGANNLTKIDVSNNNNLWNLVCDNNKITEIKLGNQPRINGIWCSNNQIESIDISNCTKLNSITCSHNKLTALDVSNNVNISFISCEDNSLSTIDVSNNKKLEVLQFNNNNISFIDLQKNTNLRTLNCGYNIFYYLDISNNKNIEILQCYGNKINNLDISNNILLRYITCYNNQLKSLDVSQHTYLEHLSFYSNQITSINISNCQNMVYFNCGDNKLTSLNTSNNKKLTSIDCWQNEIASLDVSNNTELTWLSCWDNRITELDIVNCPKLQSLQCRQLNKLILYAKTGQSFKLFNIGNNIITTVIYK